MPTADRTNSLFLPYLSDKIERNFGVCLSVNTQQIEVHHIKVVYER